LVSKSDTLEGKIELNGMLKFFSKLGLMQERFCYRSIKDNGKIIYFEGNKKYVLKDGYIDVLNLSKSILDKLKNKEEIPKIRKVYLIERERWVIFQKNENVLFVKNLSPYLKEIKVYNNNFPPESLVTKLKGIKFKAELREYEE